ncbi:MAG: hypothetical protein HOJ54_03885, partial [Phycisphaerae bacterium]|nr:hypothetical protein [Phycisphaerae bacterium]
HRDEEWRDENPDKVNLAELILAKQRNGPTGTVKLNWDSRSTCFREYVDAPGPGGGGSQWSQPAAAAIPPPTASDDDLPI